MGDEILLAQPKKRCAKHFGRAPDEIMNAGLKCVIVLVIPRVLGHIAVLDEDLGRVPILLLARKIPAALENENALAGRRKLKGQRTAARTAADDDDVEARYSWRRRFLRLDSGDSAARYDRLGTYGADFARRGAAAAWQSSRSSPV